jgi:hypothetical protein
MIDDAVLAAILPVVEAFHELKIPYYLTGSVVSSMYGRARSTMDVDVVAEIQKKHVPNLMQRLGATYYIDDRMILHAIERCSTFNIIRLSNMMKVDVYLPKSAFDRSALLRARQDTLTAGSPPLCIASVEDAILSKLAWFRQGGESSKRQWTDVQTMIEIQKEHLDRTYLKNMAAVLQVTDLLEKILPTDGH